MTFHSTAELYRMFLDSQWWIDLSFKKRCTVGKCERCGCGHDLQSHHIRYPEHWFDTRLEDLIVLCRECHQRAHNIVKAKPVGKRKRLPKRFRKSMKQRVKQRRRRERLQGLTRRSQWKLWQNFRTTPIHHYVNRGTSTN